LELWGGFGAKLVKRKDRHITHKKVKEKKKELRRKEGKSERERGEGSHTKTFPPNKINLIN
jgi:hypothetical protein